MYKVIFKLEKYGDKEIDREVTIMSIEMDLEFTSKSEIKLPSINEYLLLNNEEFIIKRKIDSIEKFEDDICYVKIVFLESVKLTMKKKSKKYNKYKSTPNSPKYQSIFCSDDPDSFFYETNVF